VADSPESSQSTSIPTIGHMNRLRIAVLGGTGFVGHSLCASLATAGHEVRVLTRRRERHRDFLVLPTVHVIDADVHSAAVLRREFEGMDAVVNLVGILHETRRDSFERAHVELPARVVQACRAAGVARLLHMSALPASEAGPSRYLLTKGHGERLVLEANGPEFHVTVFRPSVIFGPRDHFTNRFAGLLRQVPWVFPLACAQSRIQPVYVDDVARAFSAVLDRSETFGQRYDLCGPQPYTLLELVTYLRDTMGLRRTIVPLGPLASRLQAAILQFAPGKPFTPDNYRSLTVPSVCSGPFPACFGFQPTRLESIVPSYLR
jgi:uncharacterized protein YbjT (DUF2867 family)